LPKGLTVKVKNELLAEEGKQFLNYDKYKWLEIKVVEKGVNIHCQEKQLLIMF